MHDTTTRIGIVTISDRASSGIYADKSGPAIARWLEHTITSPWTSVPHLIADEKPHIEETLCRLTDREGCALILTTGGTGPSARDVTPEATEAVCDRIMHGFGEQMRRASLGDTPTAILSRQTAGLRGNALIVNLPGKPDAIAVCLAAIFMAVPVCLRIAGSAQMTIRTDFYTGPRRVHFPEWQD